MKTTNLNIRIDKETKEKAEAIFHELGITTSSAINMFLKATIRKNTLPFSIELDTPNINGHKRSWRTFERSQHKIPLKS
ncbi:type II toxin-antitoxin system RelB/DinJ family antitoxin [Mycoplasma cottewii]|uniref:Type II toxin-antitoxin system RelB/DinJ family antitoxin n=1 Tax=Mycoplasma cottewii TaxID=51364 RepID=A0ABY5TWF2_9MOLU|nr:type II toxin-antitoxin system RelB/DinJ family antitoxin [Mycoplasma cottewii]UWD34957.1 type II toxin-antitoxin system RelB/DinJ family antitoxin [Mycoplasma cottewii]